MSDAKQFHVSVIPWPVCSPDLTVPNLFLWAYLKKTAYTGIVHTHPTVAEAAVRGEIAIINKKKVFRRIVDSFVNCRIKCVANEGGHLQDVTNKK